MDVLQAKATDSMSYVKTHLDRYPDIKVVVPEELAQSASEAQEVFSAVGLSDTEMTAEVRAQLQEWGESALVNAIHHGAEYAFDAIPVVSIGVTMLIEGQRVLTGRSTVSQALRSGGRRIAEASIWASAGVALTAAGVGEPLSAAAVAGARAYAGRVNKYGQLADTVESNTVEIKRLLPAEARTES